MKEPFQNKRFSNDKFQGDKKKFGHDGERMNRDSRPDRSGDRTNRDNGQFRGDKKFSDNKQSGENRQSGDNRQFSDNKQFGDNRQFGDKRQSQDDRQTSNGRPYGDKFKSERSFGKPEGKFGKPERSFGKPERKFDKPEHSFGKPERKFDKPERSFGKPERKFDKPERSFGKPEDKFGKPERSFRKPEDKFGKPDRSFGKPEGKFGKPERSFEKPERKFDKPEHGSEKPERKFEKPENDFELPEYNHMADNDDAEGENRIEGRNPVIEALKAGRSINKIFISKGDREGSVTQIIAMAKEKKIVLQEVDRSKLDSLSVTHAHQGVIAFAAAKEYVEVDDIIEAAAAKGEAPFIIILDEINDPYNLGSILRTADAAGAHGVIIPKRRAIGLTAAVAKASAGAIEHVPVARVTNISQTIEQLKKNNIWVAGTDSTGEKAFYDTDLKGPIALVVGSEGEGMGKLVRESCDFVVNIPMKGMVSSLNAAVAGAIVMYEIQRQRGKKST